MRRGERRGRESTVVLRPARPEFGSHYFAVRDAVRPSVSAHLLLQGMRATCFTSLHVSARTDFLFGELVFSSQRLERTCEGPLRERTSADGSLSTQCNTHASVVSQTCASITCSHVSFASNMWLRACFLVFVSHLSDQVEIAHGFGSAPFQQLRRWHHGPSSHHSMHSSCFRTVTSASCFFLTCLNNCHFFWYWCS